MCSNFHMDGEEQFVQIPRAITVFIANDQSVIEQLKLIKLLGLSLHHGGQLVKISAVCDSHKYIYSRWQGDEIMFLSRRPSLLGGGIILQAGLFRTQLKHDRLSLWFLMPRHPRHSTSPVPLISDRRRSALFIHEMHIRSAQIRWCRRYWVPWRWSWGQW